MFILWRKSYWDVTLLEIDMLEIDQSSTKCGVRSLGFLSLYTRSGINSEPWVHSFVNKDHPLWSIHKDVATAYARYWPQIGNRGHWKFRNLSFLSSFASIKFIIEVPSGTTTVSRMEYNNTVRIECACTVTSSAVRQQSKMSHRSFILENSTPEKSDEKQQFQRECLNRSARKKTTRGQI